jgi:hypothetical protein
MDAVRAAHKWQSHKEKLASYMESYRKKSRESTSSISVLVAPPAPLLSPHLKFQRTLIETHAYPLIKTPTVKNNET